MTDYIARETARDLMYHKQGPLTEYDLDEIEAADVASVKHGQWDRSGYCSECDFWTCYCGDYHYCPNCGTKMDLKE